jgi:Ca2+-binding EF-hand superfamily protein
MSEVRGDISRRFSLLGVRGFAGRLKGLIGSLTVYNDAFVNPVPMLGRPGQFLVILSDADATELVVRRKNIEVVKDYAAQAHIDFEARHRRDIDKSTHTSTGNNRSSVKLAMTALSSQIRAAIKRESKAQDATGNGLLSVFTAFDKDGSRTIDRPEFIDGCRTLNIRITDTEIDLIWPLFDSDGDGTVSADEFMSFMKKGGAKASDGHFSRIAKEKLESRAYMLSKHQRGDRIQQKTKYRRTMIGLCQQFKGLVNVHLEHTGLNAGQIFGKYFDLDGSGDIDKGEFIQGVIRIGIHVTKKQMEILWPLVCFDRPEISNEQWIKFLTMKDYGKRPITASSVSNLTLPLPTPIPTSPPPHPPPHPPTHRPLPPPIGYEWTEDKYMRMKGAQNLDKIGNIRRIKEAILPILRESLSSSTESLPDARQRGKTNKRSLRRRTRRSAEQKPVRRRSSLYRDIKTTNAFYPSLYKPVFHAAIES